MSWGVGVGFNFPGDFHEPVPIISYEGRQLEVINGKDWETHCISTSVANETHVGAAFKSICHFLNELSWDFHIQLEIVTASSGGGKMTSGAVNTMLRRDTYIINDFAQRVFEPAQHLALGFFREGYSSNSPFYTFLSYYKIIEIPFNSGKEKGQWIIDTLPKLNSAGAKSSINRMKNQGVNDIADWLFKEGRNALSHASAVRESIVDPCDYEHWQNIVWANQIVQEIAEVTMHEKLKIPKRRRSPMLD